MDFKVGDLIAFPTHKESRVMHANSGSITLSQGAPGTFRVTGIQENGTIDLELVKGSTPVPNRK